MYLVCLSIAHIADHNQELVWFGNETASARVQNFRPCRYLSPGADHLCFSDASPDVFGRWYVINRVVDNSYDAKGTGYGAVLPMNAPNGHEYLSTVDGKTFLQAVYQLKVLDLRDYGGLQRGFVEDGCFQEIDFATGRSVFDWCALDHLELWHTVVFLDVPANVANHTGEPYGKGTQESAWDYFHLNAIDKNQEGDYFVSARHLNTVIKVAGSNNVHGAKPGSIIWRLDGKFNDFKGVEAVDLSRQHDVQHVRTTATETTLSLFNNQWQVRKGNRRLSNVQLIVLNNETMTVKVLKKYYNPEGSFSFAQGNMQMLSNGNTFAGWGTVPQITEFSPTGDVLFHAHIGRINKTEPHDNTQNYRSFKAPWTGKPRLDPKLVAYSRSCTANQTNSLVAYVSWNGATEVKSWRFHTSRWTKHGPWIKAGTVLKAGFETKVTLQDAFGQTASFRRYVSAQALDAHGNVLREVISKTFIPPSDMLETCDQEGCHKPAYFDYDPSLSSADQCKTAKKHVGRISVISVVLLLGVTAFKMMKWRKLSWTRMEHSSTPSQPLLGEKEEV